MVACLSLDLHLKSWKPDLMRTVILTCVLAAVSACGYAADFIVYYGPAGNVLPAGQYQRVEIGWKDGKPVMTVTVVMTVGGDIPIPPPAPDVTAQITTLINSVTADPNKADTSKGLAEAYKQILAVSAAGTIKDAPTLRKLAETLIDALLSDPKVSKAATWKPFTDGMKALTASMDFAGVVSAYTIAQGLLGGGPTPPPPPPPIPTTIMSAVILYESQQLNPQQNLLLNNIRNDQWLKTKKLQILDQNAKGPKGVIVPQVNAVSQAVVVQGKQLPVLAGLNAAGSVVFVDNLPNTIELIIARLKEAGL